MGGPKNIMIPTVKDCKNAGKKTVNWLIEGFITLWKTNIPNGTFHVKFNSVGH